MTDQFEGDMTESLCIQLSDDDGDLNLSLEELSYRKGGENSDVSSDRPKTKETFYLEAIDDGHCSARPKTNTFDFKEFDDGGNRTRIRAQSARISSNHTHQNNLSVGESCGLHTDDGIEKQQLPQQTLEDNVYSSSSRELRSNDAGNGIELIFPRHLLPKDSQIKSEVWSSEERGSFLRNNDFTHQQRFETDIFHIHSVDNVNLQDATKCLCFPTTKESDITVNVNIPNLTPLNGLCQTFHAHVKYLKKWTITNARYHVNVHGQSIVTFNTNRMESFFIESKPRDDRRTITTDGYKYVSDADSRIQVEFPRGAVLSDTEVNFRVIPLKRNLMADKIKRDPKNSFILAISECLHVRNSVSSFEKPVKVQLPVDDLPGVESRHVECRYVVCKRKDTKKFYLTDLEVVVDDGIPTVLVSSFSEHVILKVRSEFYQKIKGLLPDEIDIAMGENMCSKIMFFTGKRKKNGMSVMLECVLKQNFDDIIIRRQKIGFEYIRQCPSPDFFFPVNQRIRINVGGRFALSKHIGKPYYFITFFPIAVDNFILFPVERYSGFDSPAYGIISFKEDNGLKKKELHVIHYDPWSSKGKHTTTSAPGYRPPVTKSGVTKKERTTLANFEETFFSDKGLLALVERLCPGAIYRLMINMNMTHAKYQQIEQEYAPYTAEAKHIQMLKSALEINLEEIKIPKIQRLTTALRESGEQSLAEKIETLYNEKTNLSKTNLDK